MELSPFMLDKGFGYVNILRTGAMLVSAHLSTA